MSIVDGTGAVVVSYKYDPYGNILSTTGTLADTLGQINPLRYRGYVYDQECNLYYLQSRYYAPTTGRFINADALASTGQGILGYNMFAYCLNNPVRYSDPSGMIPFYDDPLQQAIEEFMEWFMNLDENERDREGNLTFGAKLKRTFNSLIGNTEISGGVGVGMGRKLNILGVGGSAVMYYDIFATQYGNGNWSLGQRLQMSLSVSLTQAFEFGAGLDSFRINGVEPHSSGWILFNDTKESITIFEFADYSYFIGGNISVYFNLNAFLKDITAIWEG